MVTVEVPFGGDQSVTETDKASHALKQRQLALDGFVLLGSVAGNTQKDSLVPLKRIPFLNSFS